MNRLRFIFFFIIITNIFFLYLNSFLLFCEEGAESTGSFNMLILEEFYIYNKSWQDNAAKNSFMECLAILSVFFEDQETIKEIYLKKIIGKVSLPYFENFYNMLINDNRLSPEMGHFLVYMLDPSLQVSDFRYFKSLFNNFLVEYPELYEKEWHPKGFNKEFESFKNNVSIEEISPLSIKKNEERFEEIKKLLKFFYVYEENGRFLITYTDYGQDLLKCLYHKFLIEPDKITDYKSQFSFSYNELNNKYIYKLRNIIRHINKIQWFLEEYQVLNIFDSFFFIKHDDFEDIEKLILYAEKTRFIKSLYREIEVEKKLIQELNFILYYPRASKGDVYFMKKLKDAQNYLYENKNLNKCAYIDLPVFDLREGRTFKRYIHFLIKAGIIENETITLHYLYDVRTFCKILIMGESLAKYYCLKADEIIDLTKTLELFLKEIKPQEEKLAAEYLSDSTVSKIKHKKNYYC